jgi:hypothetical protein
VPVAQDAVGDPDELPTDLLELLDHGFAVQLGHGNLHSCS